jgi:hypothetical protein
MKRKCIFWCYFFSNSVFSILLLLSLCCSLCSYICFLCVLFIIPFYYWTLSLRYVYSSFFFSCKTTSFLSFALSLLEIWKGFVVMDLTQLPVFLYFLFVTVTALLKLSEPRAISFHVQELLPLLDKETQHTLYHLTPPPPHFHIHSTYLHYAS